MASQWISPFKEELTLILFQKIAEEIILPNSICEVYYHPDTKSRQRYEEKKKTNITDEQRYKNPQQNSGKPNSTIH